jgi:hypothetical protein
MDMINNKISSNKNAVSKNLVYGRVYMPTAKTAYPGTDSTYKKLRNKTTYGRRKQTYGSKGKSTVESGN